MDDDELKRKVPLKQVCPFCKVDAWTKLDTVSLDPYTPAFIRHCTRCGFIALYSRAWTQQQAG